jgi:hypothetical protein
MRPTRSEEEYEEIFGSSLRLAEYEAAASRRRALYRASQLTNRASNVIVMGLMLATSGVALFDLYLLGTAFPH